MREASIERVLHEGVLKAGGRAYKITSMTRGVPDRLVLWPGGRMHLVELKTEDGKLSPVQQIWHERVAELGTQVVVLYGADEVRKWIREQAAK